MRPPRTDLVALEAHLQRAAAILAGIPPRDLAQMPVATMAAIYKAERHITLAGCYIAPEDFDASA